MLSTVPLMIFARRVIEPATFPLLFTIAVFYLSDKARALFSPLPGVYRFLILLEVLGIILMALIALRRSRE